MTVRTMPRDTTRRLLDVLLVLQAAGADPVPLSLLRERIDTYDTPDPEAGRRKFERDKDKLREYGISIEYVGTGAEGGYRLDRKASFLRVPVELDPDDRAFLAMLAREALTGPGFPHERALRLALAKLGADEPAPGDLRIRHPIKDDPEVAARVEALSDALVRRKRVTLEYRSVGAAPTRRAVAPYGLFLNDGHWYLVGLDDRSEEIRVFRVSRMLSLTVNPQRPKSPDYDFPEGFRLRDYSALDPVGFHAHPPEAVEVRVDREVDHLARTLWGDPVPGDDTLFRFESRNHEAVIEQVLRLGRHAEVVAPATLRARMADALRILLAAHGAAR